MVLLVWHSRLMLCAPHLRVVPRLYTIHDEKPAGRLAGASQWYFGMRPIEMSTKGSNQAANREILKALKTGASVGLTVDGPRGPARVVKQAPLDWARISGAPVFPLRLQLHRPVARELLGQDTDPTALWSRLCLGPSMERRGPTPRLRGRDGRAS